MSFHSIVINLPESSNFLLIAGLIVTAIGIGVQIYFNNRTLKSTNNALETSNLQHKQNLDYQEKIALFEKRKQLIDKLSIPEEFIYKIIHVPVLHFNGETLSIHQMITKNIKFQDVNAGIIETDAVIKIHNIATALFNELILLFSKSISDKFEAEVWGYNRVSLELQQKNDPKHQVEVIRYLIESGKILHKTIGELVKQCTEEAKLSKE